jgi:hypothetical protein
VRPSPDAPTAWTRLQARLRRWAPHLIVCAAIYAAVEIALFTVDAPMGPWRGRVIDAGSGQPIEGAVVVTYWPRAVRGLGIHDQLGGGLAREAVTVPDGRFFIPARPTATLNPFVYLKYTLFVVFKPGYGSWRFRGPSGWKKIDSASLASRYVGPVAAEGFVLELVRLETPAERNRFMSDLQSDARGSPSETPRLWAAIRQENAWLDAIPDDPAPEP